ncbi:MAG: argininosuccinate synthase [Dehalococcoidia bacterium]
MNYKELLNDNNINLIGAVSGGLDSCTITSWLKEKGFNLKCITVDLGQPDEENINTVADRMKACGASEALIVSGLEKLAKFGLKVIQSQAKYEGGYWNTTGIARPVTVASMLDHFESFNSSFLFHGATGRGNDQVRFELATKMLDPNINVYAPWRDHYFLSDFPGRAEMIDYCEHKKLPIKPKSESRYSTDANLLGLTHEAGDLENIEESPYDFVEPGMGKWPWEAQNKEELISLTWNEGIPTHINGEHHSLVEIFKILNDLGGNHGIGIGIHSVENRFLGIKSRGIYESPSMELLGESYEYLLQLVLDRRLRDYFSNISSTISKQIYEGFWFDTTTNVALSGLSQITKLISGTIVLRLYKGKVYFEKIERLDQIKHSLYTDDSSMENLGEFNHEDSQGFLNILGLNAKNLGKKHNPSNFNSEN